LPSFFSRFKCASKWAKFDSLRTVGRVHTLVPPCSLTSATRVLGRVIFKRLHALVSSLDPTAAAASLSAICHFSLGASSPFFRCPHRTRTAKKPDRESSAFARCLYPAPPNSNNKPFYGPMSKSLRLGHTARVRGMPFPDWMNAPRILLMSAATISNVPLGRRRKMVTALWLFPSSGSRRPSDFFRPRLPCVAVAIRRVKHATQRFRYQALSGVTSNRNNVFNVAPCRTTRLNGRTQATNLVRVHTLGAALCQRTWSASFDHRRGLAGHTANQNYLRRSRMRIHGTFNAASARVSIDALTSGHLPAAPAERVSFNHMCNGEPSFAHRDAHGWLIFCLAAAHSSIGLL